jgi:hypothetical protein
VPKAIALSFNSSVETGEEVMAKKINCKWCGMGHAPRSDGQHWIVKSIIPARIDIKECAYHKVGETSPIQLRDPEQVSSTDCGGVK